jgi:hypothetical protein
MSHQSSSGAEKVLGMMFTAICIAGIILYKLYKHATDQQEGSQQ